MLVNIDIYIFFSRRKEPCSFNRLEQIIFFWFKREYRIKKPWFLLHKFVLKRTVRTVTLFRTISFLFCFFVSSQRNGNTNKKIIFFWDKVNQNVYMVIIYRDLFFSLRCSQWTKMSAQWFFNYKTDENTS